jgi:hypothetical protein
MKKPWRVRFHYSNRNYEEILDFATQAKARKLYDRVKQHGFLAYCMIFNRMEASVNRLTELMLEAVRANAKLKKTWKKLNSKEQAKIESLFKTKVIERIKDVLE